MKGVVVFLFFLTCCLACTSPDGSFSLTALNQEMEDMFPGKDGVSNYVGTTRWFVRPCGNTTEMPCTDGFVDSTGVCQQDLVPSPTMTTSGLSTSSVWANASALFPQYEFIFSVTQSGGNACGGTNASVTVYYACNRSSVFETDNYGPNIGLSVLGWSACHVDLLWETSFVCPFLPTFPVTTTTITTTTATTATTATSAPTSSGSSGDGGDGDGGGGTAGIIAGLSAAVGGSVLLCFIFACAVCLLFVLFLVCCICIVGCVVVGVLVSLFGLSGASAIIFRRIRKRKINSADFKMKDLPPLSEFGYRIIPYEDITFGQHIGSGAFGVVFRGRWKHAPVALKVLQVRSEDSLKDFHAEAAIMTRLGNHLNIVQFLGVAERPCEHGTELVLVTRLYEHGSLHQILVRDNKECYESDIYDAVWDIACGLDYMHREGLVHRDLALRNCLKGSDGRTVISDFGTSRILSAGEDSATTRSDIGPVRWMAPESLTGKQYSAKTDIWMFGVTVWEMVSRSLPYKDCEVLEVAKKVPTGELHLEIPEHAPEPLAEIISGCLAIDPDERLNLRDIFDILTEFTTRSAEEILVREEEVLHQGVRDAGYVGTSDQVNGEIPDMKGGAAQAYGMKRTQSEYVMTDQVPEE